MFVRIVKTKIRDDLISVNPWHKWSIQFLKLLPLSRFSATEWSWRIVCRRPCPRATPSPAKRSDKKLSMSPLDWFRLLPVHCSTQQTLPRCLPQSIPSPPGQGRHCCWSSPRPSPAGSWWRPSCPPPWRSGGLRGGGGAGGGSEERPGGGEGRRGRGLGGITWLQWAGRQVTIAWLWWTCSRSGVCLWWLARDLTSSTQTYSHQSGQVSNPLAEKQQ